MSQTQLWLDTGSTSLIHSQGVIQGAAVPAAWLGISAELVICGRLGHHVLGRHVDSPATRATTMAHGTKHSTNVLEAT